MHDPFVTVIYLGSISLYIGENVLEGKKILKKIYMAPKKY